MASVTASTTPTTRPAPEAAPAGAGGDAGATAGGGAAAGAVHEAAPGLTGSGRPGDTGSLARRMMLIATGWIAVLLLAGGWALDRTLTNLVQQNFDDQLEYVMTAMIASTEIGNEGEVYFIRPLGDQRFFEVDSGLYWQINDGDEVHDLSRSLWDRSLTLRTDEFHEQPIFYDTTQFASEPLRVIERSVVLPGSDTDWTFAVAANTGELEAQIARVRTILVRSFLVLGAGLLVMAALQTFYGLRPLRRVRAAIQRIRSTGSNRVVDPLPREVQPLVQELNGLLAHSEKQAEEARTHAGNLAHALKTPLTVLTNAATARDPKLDELVRRETRVMQRHVEHHLARARAVGRRATGLARAPVWASVESVLRAVTRIYEDTRFDVDGNRDAQLAIERQDLDEILGNLIENAAKYGGGSVFVTVDADPDAKDCVIWVEDDGFGIPEDARSDIFDRGARLDTGKPGTGLGLSIVRDVAEIYGGTVELDESEDLGGLLVKLTLPRVEAVAE